MLSILLVDDDTSIRLLFPRLLTSRGFVISGTAENGAEAVNLYRSLPVKPDVVIMDHRMPIKNGIDATKEILQINKEAKIIFASADNSVEDLTLSNGAISFLVKPFKFEDLVTSINKATLAVT
jgi:two-component system chemotaxis response regulator CheY